MQLDVKFAFLHGALKRKVHIELPQQDPKSGDSNLVGKLKKAMYGTRDAHRFGRHGQGEDGGGGVLRKRVAFIAELAQEGGSHGACACGRLLCTGGVESLSWLYDALKDEYDLSNACMSPAAIRR